uniref:Uncharacterized protein n=1 Tax=Chromera velia CCMP2878 TaxID=1169474 RepID=A0A0G4HVT2_9ALVE|eukprot:Cvel_8923.t1-p1 / transcript=Cvel_8923.t1 / gene=Cvel_8923 / organism=Chromera_velia_CCMP2878 / gene_product=hypothetical protein / transcript_product=hypothetical protein / location=Cvel_scaffold502:39057-40709(+) / protein_length=523 / sequence_SO=supercontig / SO=protein_coding / is_pseudo=false
MGLQFLDLQMISDAPEEGLGALADVMRVGALKSLQIFRLKLGAGIVDGDALSAFGRSLGGGGCSVLQKLELEWVDSRDEGVAALAESLAGGGLPCLREMCLSVRSRYWNNFVDWDESDDHWEGEKGDGDGCRILGEVLSTNKIPSLRSLELELISQDGDEGVNRAVRGFSEVVRGGNLSGLRKLNLEKARFEKHDESSRDGGGELGEASLHSLEELVLNDQPEIATAIFDGMSRGPGVLPALRSLRCPLNKLKDSEETRVAESLSAVLTAGKTPSLVNLGVDLLQNSEKSMNAFAGALCSPRISALQRLGLRIGHTGPDGLFGSRKEQSVKVVMLSVTISSGNLSGLVDLCVCFGSQENLEDVKALCVGLNSGKLPSLRNLRLKTDPPMLFRLEDEVGAALSGVLVAEKLPRLRTLEVRGLLNDTAFTTLMQAWSDQPPPPLHSLLLADNCLSESADAVLPLLGSRRIPTLETVNLFGTGLQGRSEAALCGAFPDVIDFDSSNDYVDPVELTFPHLTNSVWHL